MWQEPAAPTATVAPRVGWAQAANTRGARVVCGRPPGWASPQADHETCRPFRPQRPTMAHGFPGRHKGTLWLPPSGITAGVLPRRCPEPLGSCQPCPPVPMCLGDQEGNHTWWPPGAKKGGGSALCRSPVTRRVCGIPYLDFLFLLAFALWHLPSSARPSSDCTRSTSMVSWATDSPSVMVMVSSILSGNTTMPWT